MSSTVFSSAPSSDPRLNVSQAAKTLGKGEASVRRWIQQFGIPTSTEGGQNLLSTEMMQVLSQIKELREQKMRSEDIELNVSAAIQKERERLNADESVPNGSPQNERRMIAELTEALAEHNEALAQSVNSAVQQASKMADRYAESQRELGRMEAMMQAMQYQLQEAEQKARLLPEKAQALQEREREAERLNEKLKQTHRELKSVEAEQSDLKHLLQNEQTARQKSEKEYLEKIAALEAELEEHKKQNQNLQAELEQERKRSWWNKLTGNKT